MLYRNLLAMETEELLRCYPIDGAVLMGGCDKTTPGLIMGAIAWTCRRSTCRRGRCCAATGAARTLGSGTDAWKYWAEQRAGNISEDDWAEIEDGIARSSGTCMTMGTAATMMAIAEALGLTLPGASSIPAVDANHSAHGRRRRPAHRRHGVGRPEAARHPHAGRRSTMPSRVHMAMGGSTNAIIHLVAMARRAGVQLDARPLRRDLARACR